MIYSSCFEQSTQTVLCGKKGNADIICCPSKSLQACHQIKNMEIRLVFDDYITNGEDASKIMLIRIS